MASLRPGRRSGQALDGRVSNGCVRPVEVGAEDVEQAGGDQSVVESGDGAVALAVVNEDVGSCIANEHRGDADCFLVVAGQRLQQGSGEGEEACFSGEVTDVRRAVEMGEVGSDAVLK